MKLLLSLLILAAPLFAQNPGPVYQTNTIPAGSCSQNIAYLYRPTGVIYTCQSGTWGAVSGGGGGSGTVTSASVTTANGISGTVATATTTPAITLTSTLSGDVSGGSNANTVTKINGTALSGLATGILKNTTTTGVPSIAVAGDFPTLNQSTSGNAATATALAANPTNCSAGNYPLGIDASGNVESCTAAATGSVTTVGFTGGLVSVANPTTTPAFTVAGTSGGIPYFSGASSWASSAAGTINHVVGWGGAGNAPVDLGTLPTVTGGTCTNQAVTAISASAVPTCTTITSAYVNATTGTGSFVFGTSPTLVTPAITTSATVTNAGIGAVSTDGVILTNITAAAVGAQQWSPRLHLTGQGWKTAATAASQAVDWIVEVQPVQSTTNPVNELVFSAQTNAGGYVPGLRINYDGTALASPADTPGWFLSNTGTRGFYSGANLTICQGVSVPASNAGTNCDGGTLISAGLKIRSTNVVAWSSGTDPGTGLDTGFDRDAAGIVGVINGTQGTTAANYRAIKASALYSGGTTFTATGLSVGTLVGGATAGTFNLGSNGPGTVVVTMGNSATAPTGWNCSVNDRTTLSVLVENSASTTTTATFNFPAGALSGDVSSFSCMGY